MTEHPNISDVMADAWLDEDGEPMTDRDVERAISFAWEGATGADSIDTIERIYRRTPGGAFECVYPDCDFKRRDPHAMWHHVHATHGEPSLPPADFDPGPWL